MEETKKPLQLNSPKLEYFIKAFTAFLTILITLNIIKWSLYYSSFKINFTDYIEFSEALLLFFNNIVTSILALIFIFLFATVAPEEVTENISIVKKKIKFQISSHEAICIGILFWLLILLILYLHLVKKIETIGAIFLSTSFVLIPIFFYTLLNKKFPTYQLKKITKHIWPVLTLIFFTLLNLHMTTRKVQMKSIKSKIICTFYDGDILQSNNDTAFLGRTKGFIFLYDYNNKKSIIFQAKDIKKIEFTTFDYHGDSTLHQPSSNKLIKASPAIVPSFQTNPLPDSNQHDQSAYGRDTSGKKN